MSWKRKLLSAAAVAAATPILFALLPAGTANAHGYVSAPASRQAQCAQRVVPCGDIQWEPQSVEGPKGQMNCHGGNARFAELSDNNRGWRVSPVGSSVTFTWTLTVPHRTSTWEYYVLGGRRLATFDQGGTQPPYSLSHNVNLSGLSGRQTILAVWNVYDTSNAFYACIDVNVGAL
ncbi:lytic polysaccharide monooxygenase auxiliary activity family 9 protein [Allonocardiopsis opalescens]|uniref:Chitin-binding protein n=1 Tax=Allonocardiopsis opalescens TaxID=1144618 RepID=A0A2T0Q2Y3_9ACTN|nr:lytic polysaccharide monooxygenase auxiliary activity family 9 protein [Allonocardiopsis opalescens]PRX98080.1 chitin-binding protein [Allonocardiopsis opalescens]